jgi:fumarate hydratase subunit alpha
MKIIDTLTIADGVEDLCKEVNYTINPKVLALIEEASKRETSRIGNKVFSQIILNTKISKEKKIPLCQDTGIVIVFIDIGQEVFLKGIPLENAVNLGVRRAYTASFFRNSIVKDPIGKRINTLDNTPAIIHTKIIPGEKINISVIVKGFGSENATSLKMFPPTIEKKEIEKFLLDTVKEKGVNACPPLFIGIGIGGSADYAVQLSKESLVSLEPMDDWETSLLESVNRLRIGPAGLGGDITAVYLKIKTFPAHIAGLPVAININCHILRVGSVIIE